MKFKPGDRKKRWKQTHNENGLIFAAMGTAAALGVEGTHGIVIAIFMYLMAFLDIRDAKRGWKISYDLPPWAERHMKHANKDIQKHAREAARATIAARDDPDRQRYAFDE